jgi:ParB-like chromosome segregation protein Spo0J
MTPEIKALTDQLKLAIESETDTDAKIELLNEVRYELHTVSPNEYNPNKVAPPEWAMLNQSVEQDGYTMSIVAHRESEGVKIVDGFHRRLVERTNPTVSASTFGRVPITQIRQSVADKGGRMASTILHNRARGSHNIELMSQIVAELVEMGKGDAWICKHVGMSADELLRLKQITGLAALFTNKDFSQSWEVEGHDEEQMVFENEN